MFSAIFFFVFSVICIFTVNVNSSPDTLKLEPNYRTITRNINESVSVKCYIGDRTGISITWIGPNGETIPLNDNRNVRRRVESTSKYAKLIIENLNDEDGGSYVCKGPTSMSASFTLEILDPITFNINETTQFAVMGVKHIIKCTPKQRQKHRISTFWQVNNHSIDYSRMTGLNEGLLINKVYKNDSESEYVCTAMSLESERPHIKRQSTKLIVLKEPFVESQINGILGRNVKMSCSAGSNLESVKFKWYDNFNREIVPSYENQMCFIENLNGQKSILQVAIKNDDSFGNYTCIIEKGNRTFGHIFQLREVGKYNFSRTTTADVHGQCEPPPPTSTEKVEITWPQPETNSSGQHLPTKAPILETPYIPNLTGDSGSEELKPPITKTSITTKKSSTTTTTISEVLNDDGSITTKTVIISEETIIVVTPGRTNS